MSPFIRDEPQPKVATEDPAGSAPARALQRTPERAVARPSLLARLLATEDDPVALGLRVVLGAVMLPHGLQKTVGLFGGYGFGGTLSFFTDTMGIPWPFALAAILAESVGALALVLGLFGRVAAFGIAVTMAVAALTSHLDHGFFMNWFGNQRGEGYEYHLLAIAIAAALLVRGSGRASVDRLLLRR